MTKNDLKILLHNQLIFDYAKHEIIEQMFKHENFNAMIDTLHEYITGIEIDEDALDTLIDNCMYECVSEMLQNEHIESIESYNNAIDYHQMMLNLTMMQIICNIMNNEEIYND